MERIKVLLEHIIQSAAIRKEENIEIVARVLLASIEKGCVDELAERCEAFTQDKVVERMMNEN